jgi:phosphate transport system permease protein
MSLYVEVSRPAEWRGDDVFLCVLWTIGLVASLIVGIVAVVVVMSAAPALHEIAPWRFVTDPSWHPAHGRFNLLPMIVGTFFVAGGALILATVFGLSAAIFCCFYAHRTLAAIYSRTVELLAGIPSVLLGFWGLTVLVPIIASLQPPGASALAAILILTLMVVPTISLVAMTSLNAVPKSLLVGAEALAFSKWSTVVKVAIPAAKRGLVSSIILGAGRALGETMAVLMVSGNIVQIPDSVFAPIRTLAANIALEIPYAEGLHRSALFVSGLFLTAIVIAMLCFADWLDTETTHE